METLEEKLSRLEKQFNLTEAKKRKKKICSSKTYTTGCIPLNNEKFNIGNGTAVEISAADQADIDAFLGSQGSTGESAATGDCASSEAGGCAEGLENKAIEEDFLHVSKLARDIELPSAIKLVPAKTVFDAVKELDPREKFHVGYITYLYCFKELEEFFTILKCTEFEGYSGIDWSDSEQLLTDKTIAHSGRQSADYSTGATNHIVHQRTTFKSDDTDPANGSGYATADIADAAMHDDTFKLGTKLDDRMATKGYHKENLNCILYYPDTTKKPKVYYYVKMKNKEELGYSLVDRDFLYEKIIERLQQAMEDFDKAWAGVPKSKRPVNKFTKLMTYEKQQKLANMLSLDDNTSGEKELTAQRAGSRQAKNNLDRPQVRALYTNQVYYLETPHVTAGAPLNPADEDIIRLHESATLTEKRETKRYYARPQDRFAANKADVLKILVDAAHAGENCTIYSLKRLEDHDNVGALTNSDIIYYFDENVLYDKNHVIVMDYDLFIKHEEERGKISDTGNDITKSEYNTEYDDRMTINTVVEARQNRTHLGPFNVEMEVTNSPYADSTERIRRGTADHFVYLNNAELNNAIEECEANGFVKLYDVDPISVNIVRKRLADKYGADRVECKNVKAQLDRYSRGTDYFGINGQCNITTTISLLDSQDDTFNQTFESHDAYGYRLTEGNKRVDDCCICGEPIEGYGNNAAPYADGTCCDACNIKFVIPARLNIIREEE